MPFFLLSFFGDLHNYIPVILCKQLFFNLIQTYFCKSCTKTYNFSPEITDSENTFSVDPISILRFFPAYTHDGRQSPNMTTGYEAACYTV